MTVTVWLFNNFTQIQFSTQQQQLDVQCRAILPVLPACHLAHRYTRADDTPVLGGIAPTEEEGIEIRRAEAGDNIFTAGETQGECIPAATIQDHPATESAMDIMPHQHKSATTADFSGNPTRDEEPDTNTLKEGHAIPNEAADSH